MQVNWFARGSLVTSYSPAEPENLSSLLNAVVNTYWNEYLRYWELSKHLDNPQLSAQTRVLYRSLDQIGEAVRKTLHSLTPGEEAVSAVQGFLEALGRPTDITVETSANLIRDLHKMAIVRDCVAISLAFEVTDGLLPTAENRALELVPLIASRRLGSRAAAYLDRATRLYLWGFDPECVIMCRSVLESALVARLDEQIDLDEPPPNLDNLIRLAGEHGVLPGYMKASSRKGWRARRGTPLWQAERIKWAGNRVTHDIPMVSAQGDAIEDCATAVRELTQLLTLLFPQHRSA